MRKEELKKAMDFCVSQVLCGLAQFYDHFPAAYSNHNFYSATENKDWTTGFWTGEVWLSYEYALTDPLKYEKAIGMLLDAGKVQMQSFLDRIQNKIDVDHHDMGFLYSPSCVAGYKLTGAETGKTAALLAAEQLKTRFQPIGGFIQAWGEMGVKENYRLIIDCLNNLPLLYWAWKETGDMSYKEIADTHIRTALDCVIREDGSTWHTYFFDPQTGKPNHGETCQGYRNGSAWARGQAWGIYGLATAYRYTRREEYLELFDKVTAYFTRHLPKDLVPYWDLEFTDGSSEPKDSSAAAIAVCGILEMSLRAVVGERYKKTAMDILGSLYENYAVKDPQISNGLLLHSTYSKHSPYNTCNHYGVDECNIWGDYFYMEALMRCLKDWEAYW